MMHQSIYQFDERRNIALPGSLEDCIEYSVEHFIICAQDAIENHGSFYVALSGGSTPKKIFEKLSSSIFAESIDWTRVFLFWSDERCVPPEDPESNYKMAMDSGFSRLPVLGNHIFRMIGESDRETHAKEYEKTIQKVLCGREFDLIMLGMGDDGHTASLFPGTKALEITDRWVVPNFVPQKDSYRMTFTYPLINSAHNIAFYVMGEKKSKKVQEVLSDKENSAPSARVGSPASPALWILDDGSSKDLKDIWHPESLKKTL